MAVWQKEDPSDPAWGCLCDQFFSAIERLAPECIQELASMGDSMELIPVRVWREAGPDPRREWLQPTDDDARLYREAESDPQYTVPETKQRTARGALGQEFISKQSRLTVWAHRWGLVDEAGSIPMWLFGTLLRGKERLNHDPPLTPALILGGYCSKLDPQTIAVEYRYDPRRQSRAAQKALIIDDFREHLDAEMDRIERETGMEAAPGWPNFHEDVDVFVKFQVCGLPMRDLAGRSRERTVTAQIRKVAARLGLRLRRHRRGRPKSKSPNSH